MEKTYDQILIEISQKEIENGLYDFIIDDTKIFSLIRRRLRTSYINEIGIKEALDFSEKVPKAQLLVSVIKSTFQVFRIIITRKKYNSAFVVFPRLDSVAGEYLDKFSDPIIDQCAINNCLLLEHSIRGKHRQPRRHSNCVLWTDAIHFYCLIDARIRYRSFCKKNKELLKVFFDRIDSTYSINVQREFWTHRLVYMMSNMKFFQWFFKKTGVKNVIGANRPETSFYAAKHLNLRTIELQHGVTYSETTLYSGYRDKFITPDFFAAFGCGFPKEVYGVDEEKVINVGFAFLNFLNERLSGGIDKGSRVLVISDDEVFDEINNITKYFAKEFPEIHFFIRLHPAIHYSENRLSFISDYSNIHLDDNHINVMVTMTNFSMVIGESSTVLYEALSLGKKVGKLHMGGLNPKYLLPEDKDSFWQIVDNKSFNDFLLGGNSEKKDKRVYDMFNSELFKTLLN